MEHTFGFITGFFLVLVIALVVYLVRKKQPADGKFDERQLMLRAEGYRRSFFVTLIAVAVVMFLVELEVVPLTSATLALFVALMIGVVTFAVYCIVKDVFFHIGQNGRNYTILAAAIVLLDGVTAATRIASGTFLVNGAPTFESCSALVMALSFLVIFIALLVRRRSGEEDE